GGELLAGAVDAFPSPPSPREITLRHTKTTGLLGIEIAGADSVKHLRSLGLEVTTESNSTCTVRVPTFRVDLKQEVDLIEEVGRLHGVETIPATPPRGAIGSHAFDAVHDIYAEARR